MAEDIEGSLSVQAPLSHEWEREALCWYLIGQQGPEQTAVDLRLRCTPLVDILHDREGYGRIGGEFSSHDAHGRLPRDPPTGETRFDRDDTPLR